MPQGEDAAINSVIADDTAIPALLNQLLARDYVRLGMGQGDQDLHDARLKLPTLPVYFNGPFGGLNAHSADIELRFTTEIDPSDGWSGLKSAHDHQ